MNTVRHRTPLTIATVVSLLVLAVALLLLGRSIRNNRDAWRWVVHTREVLEHVQTTLTLASDAEAAQRGFLLTGNEAFAAAFADARAGVPSQIRTLRTLTADNPQQQAALPALENSLDARLGMLERVLAQRRAGALPDMTTLEAGRQLKLQILAQAAGIRAEEQRLLVERQRRTDTARRELIAAVFAVATLSICLVVLLWVISSRDAARLLSERARLDTTLRSIGDGVVAIDRQGHVRLVNPVAEALTGMSEHAALGRPLADLVHLRDELTGETPEPGAAIAAGPARTWLLSGAGRDYVVELTASPILPEGGSVDGTVLVIRDVTERTARERALAESEANYRYTIELNPQTPWKAAPDGRVESASERWLALTGQDRDDVAGAGWANAVHPDDLPAMSRAWQHAVATGEPYAFEHRIRTVDGGMRWMRSSAAARRDGHGAVVAWYGLTEDIHDRKEAELAVRFREAELRTRLAQIETIYRAVPVGLGYFDADLRLVELNDALAELTGRPKAASIGATPAAALPGALGEGVGALLERVVRERRQPGTVELGDTGTDAGQRDWLGSACPVLDGEHLQGVVVTLLEVTQLKAAQRELIDINQSLEQRIEQRTAQIAEANAELRAFAHTVAHDLRAPLRNVEGFATALLEDERDRMSEDGALFAERIVAAVVRMDRLITDLLAYSRLSRAEIRLERVDFDGVLRTVLYDLESQIGASDAIVTVAPALPAVLGNQAILVQVVANLVSNAIKFVARGVAPRVAVRGWQRGACAGLVIEDNGIGIAPGHVEHVFGVFERLHGQEEYPGTGIGLAIVKKGIERMGGSVRIFARAEGGTGFELVLPAAA